MTSTKEKERLTEELSKQLGWDALTTGEIVEALASKSSANERAEIIEGYIGDNKKAKELIAQFFKPKQQERVATGRNMLSGREIERGRRMAGSVTVRHVASRPATTSTSKDPALPLVEKEACNCLSCGKIYLTKLDNDDVRQFLSSGGICTHCGAKVSLLLEGRSEVRAQPSSQADNTMGPSNSDNLRALDAAERDQLAAEAFKDRLVDYDRNARKRTTVVDDQNDFFEIDTNAWLNPEERALLKQQEAAMAAAEEARRRRVTVTVDLLGRQVILADNQEATEEAERFREAAQKAAEATKREIPQGGGTATKQALQTANKIQPNMSNLAQRPMFVQTQPETRAERQLRRGVQTKAVEDKEAEPQGVVGGWGDERSASGAGMGDRLGARLSAPPGLHDSASLRHPPPVPGHSAAVAKMIKGVTAKRSKRPQLKRVQHDDPFEALSMTALDAY